MKNLISSVFILAILGSCSKEVQEVQNTIADPPEGTYEVIFYNQGNDIVFQGKGTAFYVVINNGTQIRLDNPDPIQTSSTTPDKVASIFFQLNYKLSSPATLDTSSFYGYVSQGWYIADWDYKTETGKLKITEVGQDKIRGEFTITVVSVNSPNPNWGNHITIKGKFYAPCGGYGC
jgi:hypothetical protein